MHKMLFSFWMLSLACGRLVSQEIPINSDLLSKPWPARWIDMPGTPERDYGVYHFRKNFNLSAKPSSFIVHISADNRYRLFVNGKSVCFGPARGDLYNWYFETIDIAPFLKEGRNTIAAQVWNMGILAPVAQVSNQTAFLMQGNSDAESVVNTNRTWRAIQNKSYRPCSADNGERLHTYMVIGPGDEVDAKLYPYHWEEPSYNDSSWQPVREIAQAVTMGQGTDNRWTLKQRTIPFMEESLQRLHSIRRSEGLSLNEGFMRGNSPLRIPKNAKVSILMDQGFNTIAYPQLLVSGGRGALVKITYAESLTSNGIKGNRNEVEGKTIAGNYDVYRPDGGAAHWFRPLWMRTYRYIQMEIETGEEPLSVDDFYGMYTGYPFQQKAQFGANDKSLQEIWNVGWRTVRLCAGETYYDCPYYEQLQYEGDTRIQSLISLYVTGDDRLMRKALNDFYNSRVPEGLTQGRYPSNRLQVIPPFSLFWVSMVYDYWMHRKDDAFVSSFLHAVQGVLEWYGQHIDSSRQMLGAMPWWNFSDWDRSFRNGVPDGANEGNSSVITLQYAYTLRQAASLFAYFNQSQKAAAFDKLADSLCAGTYRSCFDAAKMAMANTPEKNSFSQHAGIMAVLAGAIPEKQVQPSMNTVLQDTSLSQATFYFRFYLTLALKKAGMADLYYAQLKPWRDMLNKGLSTFAENPDPTRSDCHAWSASPNYDFLATVCGIMPDAPGFAKVLVRPALGELQEVSGAMPHPNGMISVQLKRDGSKGINGEVLLPPNTSGNFAWQGKTISLHAGKNEIKL